MMTDACDDEFEGRSRAAIGARLRLTREALGYDQITFSEGADLKRTRYTMIENGTNMPSVEAATALCDRYHLTLDWIFFGDPSGLRYSIANAIKNMRFARKEST